MATDEAIEQRLGEDPEDESVKEQLEREHGELLEELRALIPGSPVGPSVGRWTTELALPSRRIPQPEVPAEVLPPAPGRAGGFPHSSASVAAGGGTGHD